MYMKARNNKERPDYEYFSYCICLAKKHILELQVTQRFSPLVPAVFSI